MIVTDHRVAPSLDGRGDLRGSIHKASGCGVHVVQIDAGVDEADAPDRCGADDETVGASQPVNSETEFKRGAAIMAIEQHRLDAVSGDLGNVGVGKPENVRCMSDALRGAASASGARSEFPSGFADSLDDGAGRNVAVPAGQALDLSEGGDGSGSEVDVVSVVHGVVGVVGVVRLIAAQPIPKGDRRSEDQNF